MVELIQGDCTEVMKTERFRSLLKGKNAVIVTDPPFNIGYHYKTYKDKMREADYLDLLSEVVGGGAVCGNPLSRNDLQDRKPHR